MDHHTPTTVEVAPAPKYAIYYPQAGGSLYVKSLGQGAQGSAILIQSIDKGDQLVWKKAAIDPLYHQKVDDPNDCPEVRHWCQHMRIPYLVEHKLCLRSLPFGQSSMVLVSQFCNGGSLNAFLRDFGDEDTSGGPEQFPELLIWRLLCQLLCVLDDIHHRWITHGDLLACNIFMEWKIGQRLPDFYLGDFGRSTSHDLGPKRRSEHRPHSKVQRRRAIHSIADDFERLAGLIRYLTTGHDGFKHSSDSSQSSLADAEYSFEENARWKEYSQELHDCYYMIMAFVQHARHDPNFDPCYDISRLRNGVDAVAEELEIRHLAGYIVWWERTVTDLDLRDPLLFDHPDEIVLSKLLPPGPWYLALVDPISFKVLEIGSTEYCRQESGRVL